MVNWSIIWLANSCIGAIIMAVNFLFTDKFCNIGNKYANVLPVPVGAVTIIFRFSNKHGITWVCTAVGLWNPNPSKPSISYCFNLYFLHQTIKVLYYLCEIVHSTWTVQAVSFDMMLFQELCVLWEWFAVELFYHLLIIGFGFFLLLGVRLIKPTTRFKIHVGLRLFVNNLFL